jgi:hypothetical protein
MADQKLIVSRFSVLQMTAGPGYISSPLASTNPHWAHVVGYGPFTLCVINKEGQYPSSGDINRLMMMMMMVMMMMKLTFADWFKFELIEE